MPKRCCSPVRFATEQDQGVGVGQIFAYEIRKPVGQFFVVSAISLNRLVNQIEIFSAELGLCRLILCLANQGAYEQPWPT
jgi:hypothetical protein